MCQNDLRIGLVLENRYRIVSRIAAGTMGVIYRGERLQLGRPVAIKVLQAPYAGDDKFIKRFEVEARALSRLAHPNCVSIIDFGVADAPYLVMDFVHGKTLREVLDKGPLAIPRAIHIFRQVLAALAHAHGQGIIHRDVKPGNIMLTEATGAGDHIRILDFGLAKLHNVALSRMISNSAKIVGTPAYMAPEQAQGKEVDSRSDLYSGGILLFELLSGNKPFFSDDMFEILQMQLEKVPPPIREAFPEGELSEEIEAVLLKAMAKAPDERFQSALEFAEALDATPEASRPLNAGFAISKRESQKNGDPSSNNIRRSSHTGSTSATRSTMSIPQNRLQWIVVIAALITIPVALWLWWSNRQESSHRAALVSKPPLVKHQADAVTHHLPHKTPGTPATILDAQKISKDAQVDSLLDANQNSDAQSSNTDAGQNTDQPNASITDSRQDNELPPGVNSSTAFKPTHITLTPPEKNAPAQESWQDEAFNLMRQAKKNPKNGYIPYKLGRLFFSKLWWSEGLKAYREALERAPALRKQRALILDVISSLNSRKTSRAAGELLVKKIGRSSLPYLKNAAKRHKSKRVRQKAAGLIRYVSHSRF